MLMHKSIISALIFMHLQSMVKCSGFKHFVSGFYNYCRVSMLPSETSIKNSTEANQVCKIVEKNAIKCKARWSSSKTKNYMEFFNLEKNKEQLYEGLKNYLSDSSFDAISKYAYIILLIESKSYGKLKVFLQEDIKKLYKKNFVASNYQTLLVKKIGIKHFKKFSSAELYEHMLRYKIDQLYGDYMLKRKNNIEVFLKLFSFIIYDQIDKFFDNKEAKNVLGQVTYAISWYVKDLTDGRVVNFKKPRIKTLYSFMTKINRHFELKLNEYVLKEEYDSICKISFKSWKERYEFKAIFDSICQISQQNSIFKNIKQILDKKCKNSGEAVGTDQFPAKYHDITNFVKFCKTNKISHAMNYFTFYKINNLIFIKEFYRIICLKGEMFSFCDQMFGTFVISTIIMQYQEKGKCLCIDLKRDWDLMENNFKDFTTESFISMFKLAEGYFRLILNHLDYNVINENLKDMPKFKYDYELLIKLIFGEYYSTNEKQSIKKYLNLINNHSKNEYVLDFALSSAKKTQATCSSASMNTISNADELDLNPCNGGKSDEYINTRAGKETIKKVKSFCEILQNFKPKKDVRKIKAEECERLSMAFEMNHLLNGCILARRCVECSMKIMFDKMLKFRDDFELGTRVKDEIKLMRDKMGGLCIECRSEFGCCKCSMKLMIDDILLGTRAKDETGLIKSEIVELCIECGLEKRCNKGALETLTDEMTKLFDILLLRIRTEEEEKSNRDNTQNFCVESHLEGTRVESLAKELKEEVVRKRNKDDLQIQNEEKEEEEEKKKK